MLRVDHPFKMVVLSTLRRVTLVATIPGDFGFQIDDVTPARVVSVDETGPAYAKVPQSSFSAIQTRYSVIASGHCAYISTL